MTNPDREFYDKVTLDLNVKELKSLKAKALEKGNEYVEDKEDENKTMSFSDINFDVNNEEFKEGKIIVSGALQDSKTKEQLGYLDVNMDLSLDRVLDLVNFYMKKLGKLKTVLEATKD